MLRDKDPDILIRTPCVYFECKNSTKAYNLAKRAKMNKIKNKDEK
jgi:hypothetical protein